jgi:hypothetical protein
VGDAKGHGLSVNGIMLKRLLSLADAKGVKCYWTHGWENAGRFLGRFSELVIGNGQLIGNLTLSALCDELPNLKGLGTYILKQVSDDAEILMCSVVFGVAYYFQTDETGKEYKVWTYNDAGSWVSPNYEMPIYAMPSDFQSCDIVGNGAVTDAMFSGEVDAMEMEKVLLSMQAAEKQISNKKTIEMSEVKTPELSNKKSTFLSALTGLFDSYFGKTRELDPTTPAPVETDATALQTQLSALEAENVQLSTDKTHLQTQLTAAQNEVAQLQKAKANLEALNAELGNKAPKLGAVKANVGDTEQTFAQKNPFHAKLLNLK